MKEKKPTKAAPKPRGRPPKPIPKLDASPERIARAFFASVKPPDPSLRKAKRAVRVKQQPEPNG